MIIKIFVWSRNICIATVFLGVTLSKNRICKIITYLHYKNSRKKTKQK